MSPRTHAPRVHSDAEIGTEVATFGDFVLEELLGLAAEESFTLIDQIAAMDHGENLAGIVIGDEHADALGCK